MGKSEDSLGVSNNENIDFKDQKNNSASGDQKVEHTYVEMESSSVGDADNNITAELVNTSKEEENIEEVDNVSLTNESSVVGDTNTGRQVSANNSIVSTHKRSNQLEYIQRIVLRALWKHPQSWPFRVPVDPVKDNAQDYYNIIKNPMDLGTIRCNLLNGRYENAEECINDFRLIFENCYTYNSEGLMIRGMCECVEEVFNEKIKNMPPLSSTTEYSEKDSVYSELGKNGGSLSKKRHKDGGGAKAPSKKKKLQPNTSSNKPATSHKNELSVSKTPEKKGTNVDVAPRRDSRKPSIVNASRSHTPSQNRHLSINFFAHTPNVPSASTSAALKYCLSMVRELFTKKHADYAWPFYDPVDSQSLQLHDYDNIIHYPVDLNSISKNIENGKYLTAFECITDLRRMVTNSCRYNPPEHIVSQAGQRLIVAIELLIAKAPPEVYDFLVVAPCSIIVPKIDALPEAVTAAVSMCKQKPAYNQRSSSKSRTRKPKKEQSYISDEDCDDDFVDPMTSKAQHGGGFVNVEMSHAEPMTYEEKRKLSLEINRMPTEKLGDIIAFLSDLESDIFKEKNQSEVEIDFDNMKPETLRALEKYVKYLNKPQKSRKKKPLTSNISSFSSQYNDSKMRATNTGSSRIPPSPITNISNPLMSTLKKPINYSDSIKKTNTPFSSSTTKYQVVSSLPLSEESDCSNDDDNDGEEMNTDSTKNKSLLKSSLSHTSASINVSSVPNVHSNISISKSISNVTNSAISSNKSSNSTAITTSKNVANKLTFDTVDVSFLPSSMLETSKVSRISSSDLINEAKATVKQQKLANLNSASTQSIPCSSAGSDNDNTAKSQPYTPVGLQNSSGESPSVNGRHTNKHTVSILTSNSSGTDASASKPEIRGDTNAPRAPSTAEERERMKQEERQRRLAVASTTHSNKISGDMISSFDEKL